MPLVLRYSQRMRDETRALGARITALRAAAGHSLRGLAKLASVDPAGLLRFERQQGRSLGIGIRALLRVVKALGCEVRIETREKDHATD